MSNLQYRHRVRNVALSLALAASVFISTPASATTYEYDALGRVWKVTYDDGSSVEYHYDAAGNRTTVTSTKI
jgi:YD repeat-containing protein